MKIKKLKINKAFPEYDTDIYAEIAEEYALYEYKNKPVNKDIKISQVFICKNGIFVFLSSKTDDKTVIKDSIYDMRTKYMMPANATFVFVRTEAKDYFFDDDNSNIFTISNMADRFECLLTNTVRPQVDINYIRFNSKFEMLFEPELPDEYKNDNGEPLEMDIEEAELFVQNKLTNYTMDLISKKLESAVEENDSSSRVKYDADGNKYIKRSVKKMFNMYAVNDEWYPVASDDPKQFFIMSVLGGWFGIHKFKSKDYTQGLFYLLTCGGFGIFYVFDILQMVTGSYYVIQKSIESDESSISEQYVKRRIYLDKLDNKIFAIGGLLISVVIAYIAYKFLFCNVLNHLGLSVTNMISDSVNTSLNSSIPF